MENKYVYAHIMCDTVKGNKTTTTIMIAVWKEDLNFMLLNVRLCGNIF